MHGRNLRACRCRVLLRPQERRIQQAFRALDVGGVIINDAPSFRVDSMPYGGVRDSGLGREGVRYAIEEMTDRKMLVIRA